MGAGGYYARLLRSAARLRDYAAWRSPELWIHLLLRNYTLRVATAQGRAPAQSRPSRPRNPSPETPPSAGPTAHDAVPTADMPPVPYPTRPDRTAPRRPTPRRTLTDTPSAEFPKRSSRSAVRAKAEQPPKPARRASVNLCSTLSRRGSPLFIGAPAGWLSCHRHFAGETLARCAFQSTSTIS